MYSHFDLFQKIFWDIGILNNYLLNIQLYHNLYSLKNLKFLFFIFKTQFAPLYIIYKQSLDIKLHI